MTSASKLILSLLLVWGAVICVASDQVPIPVSNQNRINDNDILAEFDGGMITRKDLDQKISQIPPNAQGRYRTIDGQIQVLDIMAVEEAFLQKALQQKMDELPEVAEKIAAGTRQFYIQEYYKRSISDLLIITDADKRRYYDENLQAFYMYPYISISYIQLENEAAALQALAELESGADFASVSDRYNINSYAKGLKGVIKNIRLNGNIPGVGNDLDLEKHIADSKADSIAVYGPFNTATGWHLFRTTEYVPGRQKTFEEVLPELEQRTRPGVETRMLNDLTDRLKQFYAVSIDSTLVAQINLNNRAQNQEIEEMSVITANDPELNLSVKQILDSFDRLSPQEQLFYVKGDGAKQLVDQELIRNLLYVDAKANDFSQYFEDSPEYRQMVRFYILNHAYKTLVLDTIEVSSEDTRAYYESRLEEYTTPASRAIEILWFDDEKTANRTWRKYLRAVKLKDENWMKQIVERHSTKPNLKLLDNIYNNGIVTGIGPDENFCDQVWDNPVGYLSPVFTSARGDIVFFRTLRENPPNVRSFTEAEPRIFGILKKERETGQQEKVTQELFEEFNMRKYPERIRLLLSADELFNLADGATRQRNFNDAIAYYDQIIANYANGSDDYRAFFMKAFLVAEELKNESLALDLFKSFLRRFPEGDLNESAQFMIDTLEGTVQFDIED